MGSRNHRGDASLVVGWKIYYHDGTGVTVTPDDEIIGAVTPTIVVANATIPLVEWTAQWTAAPANNVQLVVPYLDFQYDKDLRPAVTQARRIHEMIHSKAWYYLDVVEGQRVAAFKFANQLADIPIALQPLAKQGKEINRSLWHAVYDIAYDDWSL